MVKGQRSTEKSTRSTRDAQTWSTKVYIYKTIKRQKRHKFLNFATKPKFKSTNRLSSQSMSVSCSSLTSVQCSERAPSPRPPVGYYRRGDRVGYPFHGGSSLYLRPGHLAVPSCCSPKFRAVSQETLFSTSAMRGAFSVHLFNNCSWSTLLMSSFIFSVWAIPWTSSSSLHSFSRHSGHILSHIDSTVLLLTFLVLALSTRCRNPSFLSRILLFTDFIPITNVAAISEWCFGHLRLLFTNSAWKVSTISTSACVISQFSQPFSIMHVSNTDLEERGLRSSWKFQRFCNERRLASLSWCSLLLTVLPTDPPSTNTQILPHIPCWHDRTIHLTLRNSNPPISREHYNLTFFNVQPQEVPLCKPLHYSHLCLQGCHTCCEISDVICMH